MNITPMAPLTDIYLCKNVGFDNAYDDTVIFNPDPATGLVEQLNYFKSKSVFTFNKCTPCKLYNSVVVPVEADKIQQCDYIFFRNLNFSNKYIYAFITNIQFQNVGSTIITYEVDPIQTFMYDMELKDSFIERETVANDSIGSNLIEEGIETGPYITYEQELISELKPQSVLVGSTVRDAPALDDAPPEFSGRVFSGISLIKYDIPGDKAALEHFINEVNEKGKQEAIVSMVQMPTIFATKVPGDEGYNEFGKTYSKNFTSLDGYVPRNNKLFCYPYNFLNVSNNNGTDATYAYELFNRDDVHFRIIGVRSLSPEIILAPREYKVKPSETNIDINYEEKLTLNGFPMVGWSTDAFKAYLAQNAIPTLLNAAGSIAQGTAAGAAVGGPAGAVTGAIGSGVGQVLSAVTNGYSAYIKPPQAHGTTNPNANYASGILNFMVAKKGITYDFARRIDNFFTMFGYKVDRIGRPNLYSRSRFNYVKTINLSVRGEVPADDLVKIKGIFDNGIRFWHDHVNIGSYAENNNII